MTKSNLGTKFGGELIKRMNLLQDVNVDVTSKYPEAKLLVW
jgi:hypothetical protein